MKLADRAGSWFEYPSHDDVEGGLDTVDDVPGRIYRVAMLRKNPSGFALELQVLHAAAYQEGVLSVAQSPPGGLLGIEPVLLFGLPLWARRRRPAKPEARVASA